MMPPLVIPPQAVPYLLLQRTAYFHLADHLLGADPEVIERCLTFFVAETPEY